MEHTQPIYSLEEIRAALSAVYGEVAGFCGAISDATFLARPTGKWSVAENLEHLILSSKPVAKGLKLPKLAFLAFGTAKEGSRSYEDLARTYQQILAQGGRATGAYVPDSIEKLPAREELLAEWHRTGDFFQRNLDKWSEQDLDKYRMPHPLLGKLTVREMLFFTIHHTLHHLKACQRMG
jgi:hypothetical protein